MEPNAQMPAETRRHRPKGRRIPAQCAQSRCSGHCGMEGHFAKSQGWQATHAAAKQPVPHTVTRNPRHCPCGNLRHLQGRGNPVRTPAVATYRMVVMRRLPTMPSGRSRFGFSHCNRGERPAVRWAGVDRPFDRPGTPIRVNRHCCVSRRGTHVLQQTGGRALHMHMGYCFG